MFEFKNQSFYNSGILIGDSAIRSLSTKLKHSINQRLTARAIRRAGFLFIDIPRTGSSTARTMLATRFPHMRKRLSGSIAEHDEPNLTFSIASPVHVPATEWRRKLGEACWAKLYKFSIVRNPWERLVSIYKYRTQFEHARFTNFADFLCDLSRYRFHDPNSIFYWDHWRRSQWSFLADTKDELLVDEVYRFEDAPELFQSIAKRVGVTATSLLHCERTRPDSWRDYYLNIDLTPARQFLAEDIFRFGYSELP